MEILSAAIDVAAAQSLLREYRAENGYIKQHFARRAEEARISRGAEQWLENADKYADFIADIIEHQVKYLSDLEKNIATAEKTLADLQARTGPVKAELAAAQSLLKEARTERASIIAEVNRIIDSFPPASSEAVSNPS